MLGGMVIGSLTTPLSKRLTLATSAACALAGMFLCTMPMPPSCASAMARRASVTVSMAADTSGIFSSMARVSRVFRLTSRGRTVEWAGTSETSSKVSAFCTTRMLMILRKKTIIRERGAWSWSADCALFPRLPLSSAYGEVARFDDATSMTEERRMLVLLVSGLAGVASLALAAT